MIDIPSCYVVRSPSFDYCDYFRLDRQFKPNITAVNFISSIYPFPALTTTCITTNTTTITDTSTTAGNKNNNNAISSTVMISIINTIANIDIITIVITSKSHNNSNSDRLLL